MFLGQIRCTVRNQELLALPKQFLEELSIDGFIIQGFDRNLCVLTTEAFNDLVRRIRAMNITDPSARLLSRMILGTAAKIRIDQDNITQIPQSLIDFAGIEDEAILVGQGDYFEIWAPVCWNKQTIRLQDVEANLNRFALLDISGEVVNR